MPGLGRLHSPDTNDTRFLMAAALPPLIPTTLTFRNWWDNGTFLDQGETSECVEYSWHHWVQAGPLKPRGFAPFWNPLGSVYDEAKKIDEWPGEDYDGTSVRAGAKVLQQLGFIETYLWAWDINTLIDTLLTTGPVVVGTNWYRDMFYPDDKGWIKIGGRLEGGHAYLLTGVSKKSERIRIKNSWGRNWGKKGRAYISFDDMARLIDEDGEACLAVERRP